MAGSKFLRLIWSHRSQPEISSGGCTHQEEEVRRLWVIYPRDPLEKGLLFSGFAFEKVNDESRLPDGNSQNLQPLLMNWKQRVTSPHHSVWFDRSCSPGQCSDPIWFRPRSVPHLRLPMMQLDVCVGQELFINNPMHVRNSFWFAHCVNIVKVRKDVFIVSQPPLNSNEGTMLPQCEQQGHEGRPAGRNRLWPTDFGHRYPTDVGQTDFGQTDFGRTDFGRTDFGQNRLWPKPTLAKVGFGQKSVLAKVGWPKSVWPKSVLAKLGHTTKTLTLAKVGLAKLGNKKGWPKSV